MIALLYLFLAGIAVGFGIATVVALVAVHELDRVVVRRGRE